MRIIAVIGVLAILGGCTVTSKAQKPTATKNSAVATSPNGVSGGNGVANEQPINRRGAQLTSDFSRSKLIAADFVAAIAQIPSTNPATTVLHTTEPTTRFGELLLSSLQRAGFDLRIGPEIVDPWLAYNAVRDEQASVDGNPVITFIVAAGDVKLKRSYEVDQFGVVPTGRMFVRGASGSGVVVDDTMFGIRKPEPGTEDKPEPEKKPMPVIADLNSDGVSIAAVPTAEPFLKKSNENFSAEEKMKLEQRRELEESVAALAPLKNRKNAADYSEFSNIYESEESRYEEILQSYELVDSTVLVFPNDSLVLGKQNKKSIVQYASAFNPETDVMSVIGCSHGTSNIENGNAYLANGRAFRVKEEFIAAGLASRRVLEEGCWANVAYAKMPSRGVLVQHKRRTNQ